MDWLNGLPEVKSGKRFSVRKIIPTVRDVENSEEAELLRGHGKSACVPDLRHIVGIVLEKELL